MVAMHSKGGVDPMESRVIPWILYCVIVWLILAPLWAPDGWAAYFVTLGLFLCFVGLMPERKPRRSRHRWPS